MNARLRLLAEPPKDIDDWQPGMMWPIDDSERFTVVLSRHTDSLGESWPTVWHCGPPWTVAGEPPNITVRPSIRVVGVWHGFITDGEVIEIPGEEGR
jgi:hypothetical protein